MKEKIDVFVVSKLPSPLSSDEFVYLMNRVKDGDVKAREKVAMHNIRLVINLVFTRFKNSCYDLQELVAVGMIGLINAIDSYDLEKNRTFFTYASRCVENEILLFIKKDKNKEESLDEMIFDSLEGNGMPRRDLLINKYDDVAIDYEMKEIREVIKEIVEKLDGRDREIIKLYFGFYEDRQYSQNEIALMMGMTRSNVSRIMKYSLENIGYELKNRGVIAKDFSTRSWIYNTQNKNAYDLDDVSILNTIYGYFHNYSHQQVDSVLEMLSKEELELLNMRYGSDFDNPDLSKKMYRCDIDNLYGKVIPKMRMLLEQSKCVEYTRKRV